MARRRHHEEHENHERWLVSYADFITLLFAFFVVMYSISSINEGKYKVISQALIGVFNDADRSLKIVDGLRPRPLLRVHAGIGHQTRRDQLCDLRDLGRQRGRKGIGAGLMQQDTAIGNKMGHDGGRVGQ